MLAEHRPLHLPFRARKQLRAKTALYDALGDELDDGDTAIRAVVALIDQDEQCALAHEPLGEYLRTLAGRADGAALAARGVRDPGLLALLDRYREALDCCVCCGNAATRCSGAIDADSDAVATHGVAPGGCVADLQRTFDAVLRVTTTTYRALVPGAADGTVVQLGTALAAEDNALDGETQFTEAGKERIATVYLRVQPALLGRDDYDAIAALLFHESFVHAFQAVSSDRSSIRAGDTFAEGWMDHLAFRAFESYCRMEADTAGLRAARIERSGRRLHDRRYETASPRPPFLTRRREGRDAAFTFLAFCRNTFGVGSGDELALRFSLDINATVADLALRAALVRAVRLALGEQRLPQPPERHLLERQLRRYEAGQPAAAVLAELASLVT